MNRNENEGFVDKVKDALGMGDEHGDAHDEPMREEPVGEEPMYDERTHDQRVGVGGRSAELSNDPQAESGGESPYGTRDTTDRTDYGTRRDDDLA